MRMLSVRRVFGVAAAIGCTLAAAPAHAASIFDNLVFYTSGAVLDVDPSPRSVGMGGASTAVFWGEGPNDWANPALLGNARGIRLVGSTRDIAPGQIYESSFRSQRLTLGAGGIGVSLMGEPFKGTGAQRLESPPIDFLIISPYDTTALSLHSKETERSWGVGASLAESFESLARWRGHEAPAWTQRVDVAFGLNRKTIADYLLDPANPERLVAYDWGALARASLPLRRMLASHPGSIDVSIATAMLNANDAKSDGAPTARQQRTGGAVRTSIDTPGAMVRRVPKWLSPGMKSLASVALAYDATRVSAGGSSRGRYAVNAWGVELALGGLLFGRVGGSHSSMGSGSTNHTWGAGAALPFGRWGAAHYDYAHVDRPYGGPLTPQSWAVVVDPVAIARRR